MPNFLDYFEYVDHWLSFKTKFDNHRQSTADRSIYLQQDGNVIRVFGGKITGIFDAELEISKIIN